MDDPVCERRAETQAWREAQGAKAPRCAARQCQAPRICDEFRKRGGHLRMGANDEPRSRTANGVGIAKFGRNSGRSRAQAIQALRVPQDSPWPLDWSLRLRLEDVEIASINRRARLPRIAPKHLYKAKQGVSLGTRDTRQATCDRGREVGIGGSSPMQKSRRLSASARDKSLTLQLCSGISGKSGKSGSLARCGSSPVQKSRRLGAR